MVSYKVFNSAVTALDLDIFTEEIQPGRGKKRHMNSNH